MPFGTKVSLGRCDVVLDGDPALPQKKGGTAPQFSAHVCCGQRGGIIKMPLGTDVSLSPSHIVLDGDPAPHGKGHSSPHVLTNVYCGQTVAHLSNCLSLFVMCNQNARKYLNEYNGLLFRTKFHFGCMQVHTNT